ncbi:MAG TPA: alginate lyase family protein [Bryobacteraceae bacterium]|nr:alginate lyase family protein [Bryobacteraceae bacterium]
MRRPREIAFRVRQEASNLRLAAFPPETTSVEPAPLAGLPNPDAVAEALRHTAFAAEVIALAEMVLAHRFPLFGSVADTGPEIDWRRDCIHGISSGLPYFRLVRYLDFAAVGDHKIVWELNRHQHLVLLAQAWLLTGRREFLAELTAQIDDWIDANPYMRGINWASALEVAFRAVSWLWIYHIAGADLESSFRARFLSALCRHGAYLEANLSVYFSPNTHLLGEAVALHALGLLFPSFPRAGDWARQAAQIVAEQMEAQVREDGSHFEQSSYYHLYALDMFLFHQILCETDAGYTGKLRRMAEYLAALMGDTGKVPMLGDDDGGRFFHPYGAREHFGRATLATCAVLFDRPEWLADRAAIGEQAAWWLGGESLDNPRTAAPVSSLARLFPDAGVAIIQDEGLHIICDAGPFGSGSGGHSHSDTLAIVVRLGADEILIDPGTCTYVADPALRNCFRGSAAHNTVRVDGVDQGVANGPFSWASKPEVRILGWRSDPNHAWLAAECSFAKIRHRRSLLLLRPFLLIVADQIDGLAGLHRLEQFWHFGEPVTPVAPGTLRIGTSALLSFKGGERSDLSEGAEFGWRSPVFGTKATAPVLCVQRECELPARFWAVLDFSGARDATLSDGPGTGCVYRAGGREISLDYEEGSALAWKLASV